MEDKELKYFQFPLFLLRDLMKDKEMTLNKIICFGLYKASQRVKCDIREVARQLMFVYYSEIKKMPNELLKIIENSIDEGTLIIDEDYHGFNGNIFDPETEIKCLINEKNGLFRFDEDFFNLAVELYQIRQAYKFINISGNYKNTLNVSKSIEARIPDKEPLPMVSKDKVFEFRDNPKTERDLMKFACYIAINSILGKKLSCRTTKEMILCRAHGYKNRASMPEKLPATFVKYSNRYHIDRILIELSDKWHMNFYARNMRGMYVGKLPVEQLAEYAERNKLKNRVASFRNKQRQAQVRALQTIKEATS